MNWNLAFLTDQIKLYVSGKFITKVIIAKFTKLKKNNHIAFLYPYF